MPKKRKQSRRPRPAGPGLSPLKAGGRALGDLQIAFRRHLDAVAADDDPLTPADVEARLMESLGWLLLAQEADPVPGAGQVVTAHELHDLLTEVVPFVAGVDEQGIPDTAWADELRDETRLAWTEFLTFLADTDAYLGSPEQLYDCLHVIDGGRPPSEEAEAAYERAAAVDDDEQERDLARLPATAAALTALAALDGTPVAAEEDPGPAVLDALRPVVDALGAGGVVVAPEELWTELRLADVLAPVDGAVRVPGADAAHVGDVLLETWLGRFADRSPEHAAGVPAVLLAAVLGAEGPDVDGVTGPLVAAGVLTDPADPAQVRRVPAGLVPTVVSAARHLQRLAELPPPPARESAFGAVAG